MRNKSKKFIAMFLGILMLISNISGLASTTEDLLDRELGIGNQTLTDNTTDDTMPKVSLVYMTKNNDGTFTEATAPTDGSLKVPEGGTSGQWFYVGIKMSNFDHFKAMSTGLSTATIALTYDSQYLTITEPKPSGSGSITTSSTADYAAAIFKNVQTNANSYANKKTSEYDSEAEEDVDYFVYTLESSEPTNAADSTITTDANKSNLKDLQFTIDADTQRFSDLSTYAFGSDYLAIMRMRLKANAPAGTPVLGLSQKPTTTLKFGTGASSKTYTYKTSFQLEKYLLLDDTAVDIFPAGMTDVAVKKSVDGTVSDTGNKISLNKETKYKFSAIKDKLGANPTKSGYTFSGWSLTNNGTVLTDNSEVTVNPTTMATAGITFYAVFTKDKVNYQASDFTVSGNTATYSGSAVTAPTVTGAAGKTVGTISNIKVGTTAANASTTMPINAGTYKIFITVTGTDDYNQATDLEVGTYTVNKKDATVNLTAPTSPTYGETDAGKVNVAVTGASDLAGLGYVVKYAKKGTTAYSETVPTDAGEYTAVISKSNTTLANNFNITGTQTVNFTIAPKAITATLTTPTDKVYNGETQAAVTANVSGATLTAGTDYKITYKQNNAEVTPKNAGDYAVEFVLLNNNYSIASAPTGTYTIGKKALTIPNTITIPAAKEGATGDALVKNATYTFVEGDGIVGSDVVTVAYTVTYTAPVVKDTHPAVALTKGEVTGAAKDNYEVGAMPTGLTGTVTNLPAATWKDTVAPTKTMKASDANNTETYIKTTILTDTTVLPATAKVMVDGAEKTVTLTWQVKNVTYSAKGGTYTYEATVGDSAEFDVSGLAKPTATITVTPAEITAPTIAAISVVKGAAAPTLPVSGTVTVDGTVVNYTIAWKDGDTEVTELKTDAVIDPAVTYTGTVTYTDAPDWMTVPDATKTVTLSYQVTDKAKVAIDKIEVADVTTDAYTTKDSTLDDIKDMLSAKLEPKKADGTNVTDESGATVFFVAGTDFTWEATEGETIDPKGKEYTFTAKFADTVTAAYTLPAEPVTGKVIVKPVKAVVKKDLGTKKVKKNAKIESIADIGLNDKATITLDPAVAGAPVEYAVTNWTAPSTVTDITTMTKKTGKYEFTGTIDFTSSPWLTVAAGDDAVTQTVQVYTSGGGGGSSVSVGLTLSGTTAEGLVGDKVKIDAKVTGSTSKPTWKSSDEKVATVDNEGNIVMVGEGTATVTVTVAGVSKTVKVTVGKPEATPTPTVKPTDAPIIPDNYLKPYVSGYDEGDFRPENAITRAELATMIAKLAYGDDLPDGVYSSSFWDVESDAWYNKYIGYLENLNVLNGYDEGDFRPNNLISRGEICAVIARAQKFNVIPYEGTFTDVTEEDWAKDYIQTLASMNIATGYEDGTFGPYNSLTRAEAVTIINRLLAPSEPVVTWTPWDISGHWAEADIMLAANERKLIGADEPAPEATPEVTTEPEATAEPEATENPEATAEPTATPAA